MSIVFAFSMAVLVGYFNGILVVKTGLPSFIVTLAMLFILRGATLALTRLITGRTQVPGLRVLIENDPVAWIFATDTFKWLFTWLGSMKLIDLRTGFWPIIFLPTEPILVLTRKIIAPIGGVDVTPIIWVGLLSLFRELFLGQQGLLTQIIF